MPDGRSISGNQLLDALDQLVSVAEGSDPDLLQVLVSHLRENVDGYLFPVKHLPQLLQAEGGEEGPDAHVEAGLAGHHLRLGEVHAAVARVGSWEGSAGTGGNDGGRRCSTYTCTAWHNDSRGALM